MEGKSGGAGGCLAGARDKRALNATRCGTLHLAKDRVRRRLEPKEGEHTAEMGPAALKEAVAQAGGRRAGGDVARGRLCALQAGLRVSSPTTHTGSEGSRKLRRQLPGTGPSRAGCAANGSGNAHQEVGTAPAQGTEPPGLLSLGEDGAEGNAAPRALGAGPSARRGAAARAAVPCGLSSRLRSRGDAAEVARRQLEEEYAPKA